MKTLAFNQIYHMDCLEGMDRIPEESIDLVITDPPFAIDFKAKRSNYNRTYGRVLEGYNEVDQEDYFRFTVAWMKKIKSLLRSSGSMYVFSGWNNLKDILLAIDELGYITVNHIIWKYQFGVTTKRRYVTSHYHCLYVCKDDRTRKFFPDARYGRDEKSQEGRSLQYKDKEDVWNIKREYWTGDKKTPTKLPAEILRKILSYSSEENDMVCDPFLGSGQVAVVSKMMKRQFIGFEIVDTYFDFALERLETDSYRIRADEAASPKDSLELFNQELSSGAD